MQVCTLDDKATVIFTCSIIFIENKKQIDAIKEHLFDVLKMYPKKKNKKITKLEDQVEATILARTGGSLTPSINQRKQPM
jgi:hypothetical protein